MCSRCAGFIRPGRVRPFCLQPALFLALERLADRRANGAGSAGSEKATHPRNGYPSYAV